TLFSKLHPSLSQDKQSKINLQTLMIMADIVITDYSSLAIEASLLNKPTFFYVYDEADYEKERGLNAFYYNIPEYYKAYSEKELNYQLSYQFIMQLTQYKEQSVLSILNKIMKLFVSMMVLLMKVSKFWNSCKNHLKIFIS